MRAGRPSVPPPPRGEGFQRPFGRRSARIGMRSAPEIASLFTRVSSIFKSVHRSSRKKATAKLPARPVPATGLRPVPPFRFRSMREERRLSFPARQCGGGEPHEGWWRGRSPRVRTRWQLSKKSRTPGPAVRSRRREGSVSGQAALRVLGPRRSDYDKILFLGSLSRLASNEEKVWKPIASRRHAAGRRHAGRLSGMSTGEAKLTEEAHGRLRRRRSHIGQSSRRGGKSRLSF